MPLTAETDRQERSGLVAPSWNLRDLELDAILVWTLVCDTSSQRAVSLAGLAQTQGPLNRGVSVLVAPPTHPGGVEDLSLLS